MIADRHIFVVGQQRIVGPELLADIGGVVNADVEIGVVADQAGHVQPHLALSDQVHFDIVAIALVGQHFGQSLAQRALRLRAAREAGVEDRLGEVAAPSSSSRLGSRGKIEDDSRRSRRPGAAALGLGENAERQVLDREIAARWRSVDPASRAGSWVSSIVAHGSFAFGKPAQASS